MEVSQNEETVYLDVHMAIATELNARPRRD
jgi:hypothetical protein